MEDLASLAIYEMSVILLVTWQAHSLSNAGSVSNRLLSRRQPLAYGIETDACTGNINKHYHSALLTEYYEEVGVPVCPACRERNQQRAAALVGRPGYENLTIDRILTQCAMCDSHGFLITAKNAPPDSSTEIRQRISKHSLVEFSFALALPDSYGEAMQVATRMGDAQGDGQMILKKPVRSGQYAWCIRYKSAGVGVDTERWQIVVQDQEERIRRHRGILTVLRDQVLSPSGAQTSTILPHLSDLCGAVVVRTSVGRPPMYSSFAGDFLERLKAMERPTNRVFVFRAVDEFSLLIVNSRPRVVHHGQP